MISVIKSFVSDYEKQRDKYEESRKILQKTLEIILSDAGIMAICSTRTKDPDRLYEKLVLRNKDKFYKSTKEIYEDIPDLIGGRIALYFPDDSRRIRSLLEKVFHIESEKDFPKDQRNYQGYSRRFSGYTATHYRVRFMSDIYRDNSLIEIQVASLLMHAWSEVEHDLAYKKLKGNVSYEEYETLDEINGLMLAGEISLQRLQRLTEERLKAGSKNFENHYQLAQYIYNNNLKHTKDIGDIETLFSLYEKQNRLSIRKIKNDLKYVDFDSDISVSNQLIDLNVDKKLRDSQLVIENKNKKAINEVEYDAEALGSFLKAWIKLEKIVTSTNERHSKEKKSYSYGHGGLPNYHYLPSLIREEYLQLRRIRNEIVHSLDIPATDDIYCYTQRIKDLETKIEDYKKRS